MMNETDQRSDPDRDRHFLSYRYCWVTKSVKGESSRDLLASRLPEVIEKLQFKKSMRWSSKATYSRPLRWIVALHGDCLVSFQACGVESGTASLGLRRGFEVRGHDLSLPSFSDDRIPQIVKY